MRGKSFAVDATQQRGGGQIMGKRWIVLLVIALVGILATTAFAEPKMVIVLDPDKQDTITCYRVENSDSSTVTLNLKCDNFAEPLIKDKKWKIKDAHSSGHKDFADHAVLDRKDSSIVWSNPCVTINYGGKSYTVCY
jgi:hypothetical protein